MKTVDAEKLICPFIKAVDKGGWSVSNGEPTHINCITTKCMAWCSDIEIENKQEFKLNVTDKFRTLDEFIEKYNLNGYTFTYHDASVVFTKHSKSNTTGHCVRLKDN